MRKGNDTVDIWDYICSDASSGMTADELAVEIESDERTLASYSDDDESILVCLLFTVLPRRIAKMRDELRWGRTDDGDRRNGRVLEQRERRPMQLGGWVYRGASAYQTPAGPFVLLNRQNFHLDR
jgi:hypothetical protein